MYSSIKQVLCCRYYSHFTILVFCVEIDLLLLHICDNHFSNKLPKKKQFATITNRITNIGRYCEVKSKVLRTVKWMIWLPRVSLVPRIEEPSHTTSHYLDVSMIKMGENICGWYGSRGTIWMSFNNIHNHFWPEEHKTRHAFKIINMYSYVLR